MKKRNKLILTGATLLTLGGVTGYAASNILGNLDTIRENYDITFNFAKSQQKKADDLQKELNKESDDKDKLQNEINKLGTDIENLKATHAADITGKNAEITAKQDEINAKQKEVEQKQESINGLNNQLGQLNGELAQVEAKVSELLNYTNDRTNELTGGE